MRVRATEADRAASGRLVAWEWAVGHATGAQHYQTPFTTNYAHLCYQGPIPDHPRPAATDHGPAPAALYRLAAPGVGSVQSQTSWSSHLGCQGCWKFASLRAIGMRNR